MLDSQVVWRVNRKPRFPVLSLGEYMTADDGPRETMRRNMKYERISPTILYSKLQRSVASFLASPIRDRRILDRCKTELEAEQQNARTPKAAENAVYAIRALETFERSLNSLPVGGMSLTLAPIYPAHMIEGVKVSIQPTALIAVARPRGKNLRGALIVDTAKGLAPKTDEVAGRMTEAMMHAAYLLHEQVAAGVIGGEERPSTDHCMVFHSYRQELVVSPSNYKRLLKNVEAACRDVAAAWNAITPPSSFDPTQARYRD
jgi:hypothetical protein